MARYEGKCPRCNRTFHSDRKKDITVCDCWKNCPVCGGTMTPYTPDLTMNTYGIDDHHPFQELMVCTLHSPMFFSNQKPIEVVCT